MRGISYFLLPWGLGNYDIKKLKKKLKVVGETEVEQANGDAPESKSRRGRRWE